MNVSGSSRSASRTSLVAVVLIVAAIAYRKMIGGDVIATILGVSGILTGMAGVFLLRRNQSRQYVNVVAADKRAGSFSARAQALAKLGWLLTIGSFVWLGGVIYFFGAAEQRVVLLAIWAVVFVVGCILLFAPSIVKWLTLFGLFRDGNRDEDSLS